MDLFGFFELTQHQSAAFQEQLIESLHIRRRMLRLKENLHHNVRS
jgi:hypothetical protein